MNNGNVLKLMMNQAINLCGCSIGTIDVLKPTEIVIEIKNWNQQWFQFFY